MLRGMKLTLALSALLAWNAVLAQGAAPAKPTPQDATRVAQAQQAAPAAGGAAAGAAPAAGGAVAGGIGVGAAAAAFGAAVAAIAVSGSGGQNTTTSHK